MLNPTTAQRIALVLEKRVLPHVKASDNGFTDLGTVAACLATIEKQYDPYKYNSDEREVWTFNTGWPLGNMLTSDLRYKCISKDECIGSVKAAIRHARMLATL